MTKNQAQAIFNKYEIDGYNDLQSVLSVLEEMAENIEFYDIGNDAKTIVLARIAQIEGAAMTLGVE